MTLGKKINKINVQSCQYVSLPYTMDDTQKKKKRKQYNIKMSTLLKTMFKLGL